MGTKWMGRGLWLSLGFCFGFFVSYVMFYNEIRPRQYSENLSFPTKELSIPVPPSRATSPRSSPKRLSVKAPRGDGETSGVISEFQQLIQAGEGEKARLVLEEGLRKYGERPELLFELGSFYSKYMSNSLKAIGYLERVLELDPNYRNAWEELTHIATFPQDSRSAGRAVRLLQQAQQKNPQSILAQTAYGEYMARSQRLSEAAQAFQRAAQLSGATDETRYRLADIYYQMNQPDRAERIFSDVVRLREQQFQENPNDVTSRQLELAKIDRVRALIRVGRQQEASDILQPMLDRSPEDLVLRNLSHQLRLAR